MIGAILAAIYVIAKYLFGAEIVPTFSQALTFLWRWNVVTIAIVGIGLIPYSLTLAYRRVNEEYHQHENWVFLWLNISILVPSLVVLFAQIVLTLGGVRLMQLSLAGTSATFVGVGPLAYIFGIYLQLRWSRYCMNQWDK